jgi:hypothetical protein
MLTTTRVAFLVLFTILLTGCGDKVIHFHYELDSKIDRLVMAQAITVFRFMDARGDEGDKGDPLRVGGVYGGYGNRLSKVMAASPWPDALVQNLVAGFSQRGVRAVAIPDKTYTPGSTPATTPLILTGEIRNFSTEARYTNTAHISGILRLYDAGGKLILEKPVSARAKLESEAGVGVFTPVDWLEQVMNEAIAKFIRIVVTDPELTQRLIAVR